MMCGFFPLQRLMSLHRMFNSRDLIAKILNGHNFMVSESRYVAYHMTTTTSTKEMMKTLDEMQTRYVHMIRRLFSFRIVEKNRAATSKQVQCDHCAIELG